MRVRHVRAENGNAKRRKLCLLTAPEKEETESQERFWATGRQ